MDNCMINPLLPHKVLYKYLPMRYDATPREERDRHLVIDFKEGKENATFQVAAYVAAYLKGRRITGESYTFLCLPASSSTVHHTRFAHFAELVCQECGFQNGFHLVKHLQDRKKVHNTGARQRFTDYLHFSEDLINRKVIVFDDVVTTGCTFNLFCEYLKDAGAEVVYGLALAHTIRR